MFSISFHFMWIYLFAALLYSYKMQLISTTGVEALIQPGIVYYEPIFFFFFVFILIVFSLS